MRFGAVIPVLNEWRFLPAVVGQLLKVVDRCVVARCSRSFSGAPVDLSPIPRLGPRVDIIKGDWPNEHETRNAGLEALADCDYVFTVDSDEVFLDADLRHLVSLCDGARSAIGARFVTYWKTAEYRIDPPEILVAPVVVRRDVRFVVNRRVRDGETQLADVWCRHLSYVRTDREMREKLRLFSHASEVRPGWFERVWKDWDANRDMANLHPTHPQNYRRAVYHPDAELTRVLDEYGCDGRALGSRP